MSFMDEYRAGRAGTEQLAEHINHWYAHIDRTPGGVGLDEWLGMRWPEYLHWTLYGQLPDADTSTRIPQRRRRDHQ